MFAIFLVCLCFGSFAYAKPGVRPPRQTATCGQSFVPNKVSFSADGTPLKRIVGGIEAAAHSIPWQAGLQVKGYAAGAGHFCGGALVRVNGQDKSDIIVTAAHCLEVDSYNSKTNEWTLWNLTVNNFDIVLGAHNKSVNEPEQQRFSVARLVKHPNWVYPNRYDYSINFNNDIAIVKLATPVQFNNNIQPICLPSSSSDNAADGSFGIVSGWGALGEGMEGSKELRQVTLPVVSSASCSVPYRSLNSTTNFCAGYTEGGKDSCQGDSGGPFFFKKSQGFVLYGVVSSGIGCARVGVPGLYTRVSNYLPWISSTITLLTAVQ